MAARVCVCAIHENFLCCIKPAKYPLPDCWSSCVYFQCLLNDAPCIQILILLVFRMWLAVWVCYVCGGKWERGKGKLVLGGKCTLRLWTVQRYHSIIFSPWKISRKHMLILFQTSGMKTYNIISLQRTKWLTMASMCPLLWRWESHIVWNGEERLLHPSLHPRGHVDTIDWRMGPRIWVPCFHVKYRKGVQIFEGSNIALLQSFQGH